MEFADNSRYLREHPDIITTTLWAKIRLEDAFQTENAVTDFR
jgi:hypothetical protein